MNYSWWDNITRPTEAVRRGFSLEGKWVLRKMTHDTAATNSSAPSMVGKLTRACDEREYGPVGSQCSSSLVIMGPLLHLTHYSPVMQIRGFGEWSQQHMTGREVVMQPCEYPWGLRKQGTGRMNVHAISIILWSPLPLIESNSLVPFCCNYCQVLALISICPGSLA